MTAYALGIAIGLANLVQVLIPGYGLFVGARAVAGAVHGLFIAVAFVTCMSVVRRDAASLVRCARR